MDHRWDEATLQDHEGRAEAARYGRGRIERDLDVERRDELRREERRRRTNLSPWEIGTAWYDQRDTYTLGSETDASGYGLGPSLHPEEGSYAYQRPFRLSANELRGSSASRYEKEAWPWLVYRDPEDAPYFAYLRSSGDEASRPTLWERAKAFFVDTFHVGDAKREIEERADEDIVADVEDALTYRQGLDASDIAVECAGGTVTLRGTVVDRASRKMAGETAARVAGVREVKNRLTIRREDEDAQGVLVGASLLFA